MFVPKRILSPDRPDDPPCGSVASVQAGVGHPHTTTLRKPAQTITVFLFDHPLAIGQEKFKFAKQNQGFFLAFVQGVVICYVLFQSDT